MRSLKMILNSSVARLFGATAIFLMLCVPVSAAEKLLVFCASSLTDVMSEIGRRYLESSGVEVVLSFAGTGKLARQIEAGAPADVFISADEIWMNWVAARALVDKSGIRPFALNSLVVAVRQETENWADMDAHLTDHRFAMGEPGSVPVGRYAKQALEKRGLWEKAKEQAVFGENVRVTARRLVLGEVGAAIVYSTDVQAEPGIRALFTFPRENHDPIVYTAAPVKGRKAGADDFVSYLASDDVKEVFRKFGFTPFESDR